MKYIITIFLISQVFWANAQQISGIVKGTAENQTEPLVGAVVKWSSGLPNAVLTDVDGRFTIYRSPGQHQLIISYTGFAPDTVMAHGAGPFEFTLENSSNNLDEVVVSGSSTVLDRISPQQTELITTKELAKAACCNLSESFETNASVSVSYADAITGAKQIEMLGLNGKYIQTNMENMPGIRGIGMPFGLNYIPGTWIQSIDVAKGTASVINGYESMTGALNVELLKPDNADKFYANAYVNQAGRSELNLHAAHKVSDKWSLGLMTHGSMLQSAIDRNNDSFYDTPAFKQINLMPRYKYNGDRWMSQGGVQYFNESREGGQINGDIQMPYHFGLQSKRLFVFTKNALLFPETPYRGLGLIMDYANIDLNANLGNPEVIVPSSRDYQGTEDIYHANLIYQDIFGNTQHTYKTGLSYTLNRYQESLAPEYDFFYNGKNWYQKTESIPGAFFEYTYNRLDKTLIVAGLRADMHNIQGLLLTPRIHLKQDIGEKNTARLSLGYGQRASRVIADNFGFWVSSRAMEISNFYIPEKSWNYGFSFIHEFNKNSISFDTYYTDLTQQQVVDLETLGQVRIYQSNDKAYALSSQLEIKLVPTDRWEIKTAYRIMDVKQTYSSEEGEKRLLNKMYVPKTRGLINVSYAMPYNKWRADATLQYKGRQRLPGGDDFAPSFVTVNSQVSRSFIDWEYYLGVENLTNFRQRNPIISANDPFDESFDAGQIWGPILGRMFYAGVRFKIR